MMDSGLRRNDNYSFNLKYMSTPLKEGEKPVKKFDTPRLLRGMKDVLPTEEIFWNTVLDTVSHFAEVYNFGRLRTPVLENTKLFVRSVGKDTDIVDKEMYTFEDRDGSRVTLRPEGTAATVRAYILHGMLNQPQPVKMWYMQPMFRHERPQAGRYRQHHQVGFEVIGADDPAVDAMLITIAYKVLETIGMETIVHVNSLGSPESREAYITKLVAHYKSFRGRLDDDQKKRLAKNPLRILDLKDEELADIKESAPQLVDHLDDDSRDHFMKVLEYLDELEIPYMLDPHLVRGLDYYNRTVFEVFPVADEDKKSQSAFVAGGRYDHLVEHLGGRDATPAAGFGMGVERIVSEMHRKNIKPTPAKRPQVFVAHLGELGRRSAMVLFDELRTKGFRVRECFSKSSLRDQLAMANKSAAPFALIVGQREVIEGTVIIRDMESGIQEIIDMKKAVGALEKQYAAKEEELGSLLYMPEKIITDEDEEGEEEEGEDGEKSEDDKVVDEVVKEVEGAEEEAKEEKKAKKAKKKTKKKDDVDTSAAVDEATEDTVDKKE